MGIGVGQGWVGVLHPKREEEVRVFIGFDFRKKNRLKLGLSLL